MGRSKETVWDGIRPSECGIPIAYAGRVVRSHFLDFLLCPPLTFPWLLSRSNDILSLLQNLFHNPFEQLSSSVVDLALRVITALVTSWPTAGSEIQFLKPQESNGTRNPVD